MDEPRVPLFPLGLVLLPRMPLPLYIFEDRYRLLISRCLEMEQEFGIVLNTASSLQTTGCLAKIDSVINYYDDGRMDILTVGTERFKIVAIHEDKPYLEADIRPYHDTQPQPGQIDDLVETAIITLKSFAAIAGYDIDVKLLANLDYEQLSFLLATTDVFSTEQKQQMLEIRSTWQRIEETTAELRDSTTRRALTRNIKKLIGRNEDITYLFN